MISVKNLQISLFPLFLGKKGGEKARKMCFDDILNRKNGFLDNKNIVFKEWKNMHFYKGVTPSFW